MANDMLSLDIGEFNAMVQRAAKILSPKELRTMTYRALRRSGIAARQVVVQEVVREYNAPTGWVRSQMPRIRGNPGTLTVEIPVDGARGRVQKSSGGIYPSRSAGTHYSSGRRRPQGRTSSRGGAVSMSDVRGVWSALPGSGDARRRHFMVTRGPHAGYVFVATPRSGSGMLIQPRTVRLKDGSTRKYRYSRKNEQITYAVGIGVPQMPMTRAAPAIQRRAGEIMLKRLEHEYQVIVSGIAPGKGR